MMNTMKGETMKQSYWNNDLYDTERLCGSASSETYELIFSNPVTVSDLIEKCESIKAGEKDFKEKSFGNVFIKNWDNPIVVIRPNEITKLPAYEEYKDKAIQKGRMSVAWSEFNFTLEV